MAGDRGDCAVGGVLADAGSEQEGAGESGPGADAVDEGGAGVVHEAEVAEPAAAPAPVDHDRVDQAGDEDGVEEVGGEFGALGECAGDDGGGGGGEGPLEEEDGRLGDAVGFGEPAESGEERVAADKAALAGAEGEAEADGPPDNAAEGGVEHVLHEDVGGVFDADEAGLEQAEAGLHEEDQNAGDHVPDRVDGQDQVGDVVGLLRGDDAERGQQGGEQSGGEADGRSFGSAWEPGSEGEPGDSGMNHVFLRFPGSGCNQ